MFHLPSLALTSAPSRIAGGQIPVERFTPVTQTSLHTWSAAARALKQQTSILLQEVATESIVVEIKPLQILVKCRVFFPPSFKDGMCSKSEVKITFWESHCCFFFPSKMKGSLFFLYFDCIYVLGNCASC